MPAPMSRLAPRTLRWRLAGWVAAVTLICTGIAFAAVYRGTGTQLRGQVDHELRAYAGELSHDLARANAATPKKLSAEAKRYVLDQPFSAGSTLLFVTVPGVGTGSNRSELFAGPSPDNGETPAEQAAEGRLSAQLLTVKRGLLDAQPPRHRPLARDQEHGDHARRATGDGRRRRAAGGGGAWAGGCRPRVHPGRHPGARGRAPRLLPDRQPRVAAAAPDGRRGGAGGRGRSEAANRTARAARARRFGCSRTRSTTCSTD